MGFHPRRKLRELLSNPTVSASLKWRSRMTIGWMREANEIQLTVDEICLISAVIARKAPCNLLVFGLGHDSKYWRELNRKGNTVFLEESREWLELVQERHPEIDAHLVPYRTSISQWKELFMTSEVFDLELPNAVINEKWDVILIDGPEGWRDSSPGRMQAIAIAPELAAPHCDVLVHDCNREIEDLYTLEYLGEENLVDEIGVLRHFQLSG